jgi:hypothetical protein
MKRILAVVPAALLVLAGCGGIAGDTCSSAAAQVTPTNASCRLAPNTPVTINVQLCPKCTDTSPACAGEVLAGREIQLDPVVQQCQASQGCDITPACRISPVPCTLDATLAVGTYTARYLGPTGSLDSATVEVVAGGAPSCTL